MSQFNLDVLLSLSHFIYRCSPTVTRAHTEKEGIMPDGDISLSQAAKELGVSWAVAWRLLLQGKLLGRKVGKNWWVDERSVRHLQENVGLSERPGDAA